MIRFLILAQLFIVSTALAGQGRVVIGCTISCTQYIVDRMRHAAAARDLDVQFVDLREVAGQNGLTSALASVDAVISPGGEDVDLRYYLDAVTQSERAHVLDVDSRLGKHDDESRSRDEYEFRLRQLYFSDARFKSLPLLGICYGMQMLGVSQGLPLVIDLHEEYGIDNRYLSSEEIHFRKDSLVATIFGTTALHALESHHQAVDVRAYQRIRPESTRITGISNQGHVPEALEFRSRPLALGVQFHPEGSSLEVSDRIFGWVLDRARK